MADPFSTAAQTSRFSLPLLFAGQAQKEFFVNEALWRTDLLVHCAVEGEVQAPPLAPNPGQSWLIGNAPSGDFAGRAGVIAGWTGAGWTFIEPREGMRIFDRARGCFRLFSTTWVLPSAPEQPAGGDVTDQQARLAIADLVEVLRRAGILAGA